MNYLVIALAPLAFLACEWKLGTPEATKEVKVAKAEYAFLNNLSEPQSATLYSLDPVEKPTTANFHGYKILGELKVSPEDVTETVMEFKDAVESFKDGMTVKECFKPTVGIRVSKNGKSYDYALSYECNHMRGYDGNKTYDFDAAGNSAVLNDLLSSANIPIVPAKKTE